MASLFDNYKKIISLGCPILIGQLGMIVVGFADNAMVGNYHTDALAAASFVNNVFNIAVMMCIGFTYGLTPIIGALYSKGENHSIGVTLRDALRLNIIFSLSLTLLMGVLYFNIHRLGQPAHILPLIRPYYLLYLAGVIPIAVFQSFAQWAYAVNSTKMPMWIILSANAVNILGNWLLISGNLGMPELGLTGAGIATLAARLICPLATFTIFLKVKRYRCYHDGFFRSSTQLLRKRLSRLFTTSMPVSLQMGLETASFSVAAIMAGWLGDKELAAFQVLLITGTLGFCVYYSFGTAISVVVANAAGRNDLHEMRRKAWCGYHIILVFAAIASLTFLLFGSSLVRIFSSDPKVLSLAMSCIFPMILYQLADATQITFSNALRGTSRVMPIFYTSLISYVIIGIPVTYIMGILSGWGLPGIYYSFSVSLMCAAALYIYFFFNTISEKQWNRLKTSTK